MVDGAGSAAARVQEALDRLGLGGEVREMRETTRSAAEAAAAVGCTVGQIAKSLVFRGAKSARPVLVIASGAHRVDEALVAAALGEPVLKADADFVRRRTGFAIGGVAPVGLTEPCPTLIDEELFGHAEIWAAAGTPHRVFRLTPQELQRITGGRVARIKAA
jgi:prolyl-tRNA editing enzyme YbaK/EbsC (Cys-tRNA(Pro) deacylase)